MEILTTNDILDVYTEDESIGNEEWVRVKDIKEQLLLMKSLTDYQLKNIKLLSLIVELSKSETK